MNKGLVLICCIAVAAAGFSYWQRGEGLRASENLHKELVRMEAHAQALEQQILALELENQQLRDQSLEDIIENKSQDISEKWADMVEHFAGEMEKLGELIEDEWSGNIEPTAPPASTTEPI